jgi:hypothetical protein
MENNDLTIFHSCAEWKVFYKACMYLSTQLKDYGYLNDNEIIGYTSSDYEDTYKLIVNNDNGFIQYIPKHVQVITPHKKNLLDLEWDNMIEDAKNYFDEVPNYLIYHRRIVSTINSHHIYELEIIFVNQKLLNDKDKLKKLIFEAKLKATY